MKETKPKSLVERWIDGVIEVPGGLFDAIESVEDGMDEADLAHFAICWALRLLADPESEGSKEVLGRIIECRAAKAKRLGLVPA